MPRDPRESFSLARLPENYIERLMAMEEQIKRNQKVEPGQVKPNDTALQLFRKNRFGGRNGVL